MPTRLCNQHEKSTPLEFTTIIQNLCKEDKMLRRTLSWTILRKGSQIIELVGEEHYSDKTSDDASTIELKDIVRYVEGTGLTDVFIECDTSSRSKGRSLLMYCVDSNLEFRDALASHDEKVRYHMADYRSELPAYVGFDVQFLFDLVQLQETKTNDHIWNHVMSRSMAYWDQNSPPKQFNQMAGRLKEKSEELANIAWRLLRQVFVEGKGRISAELDKQFAEIAPPNEGRMDTYNNTMALLSIWKDIQGEYMSMYFIYRILRFFDASKTAAEEEEPSKEVDNAHSTAFVLVGQGHVGSIRSGLEQAGWKVLRHCGE